MMPWFRLDEAFHHHPKVRQAGNAPIGLWVRCGTWSAQYLTDGYITAEVAHDFGSQREIDRLTNTGLWVTNGAGFVIPDYLEYNPSAEQVRAERAKARERAQKRRNQLHYPQGSREHDS